MFNKQTLRAAYLSFLQASGLQAKEVILGFGGACVMHGVRLLTNDIDVSIPYQVFQQLHDSGLYPLKDFTVGDAKRVSVEYGDGISLHLHIHVDDSIHAVMVDGVCCYSVATTLDYKRMLNRPKDQADIAALHALIFNIQLTSPR